MGKHPAKTAGYVRRDQAAFASERVACQFQGTDVERIDGDEAAGVRGMSIRPHRRKADVFEA